MNTRKTIKRVLFITMWLAIGSGMVTLLAAAMRNQKTERCTSINIKIKSEEAVLFLREKDVMKILHAGASGELKGQPRLAFDLMKLERLLEENVWIRDSELYFDNKGILHVTVSERKPVARVFTVTGSTFYIDKDEKQMPLSETRAASVPVFTGFPVKKVVSKRDKELLHEIRTTAEFISNNSFWSAQVSQIDITRDREMEMVPVVGNHIVKLGEPKDLSTKFQRLFAFYKNVLSKTGFDKYKMIDVQYHGQVIGVKGNSSRVDSVQLRKNVEKLLQLARDMQNDSLLKMNPSVPLVSETGIREDELVKNSDATTLNKPPAPDQNPNPVKPVLKNTEPVKIKQATSKKEPKAVMPARNQ